MRNVYDAQQNLKNCFDTSAAGQGKLDQHATRAPQSSRPEKQGTRELPREIPENYCLSIYCFNACQLGHGGVGRGCGVGRGLGVALGVGVTVGVGVGVGVGLGVIDGVGVTVGVGVGVTGGAVGVGDGDAQGGISYVCETF